jgi:transglutaminase-like putative cysteine protease
MSADHDKRLYRVVHTTAYDYDAPVTNSYGRGCLRPRPQSSQTLLEHTITIDPQPQVMDETRDLFGNYTHYLEIHTDHERLEVVKESVLEVEWPEVDLVELDQQMVGVAAARLRHDGSLDPVEHALYTLPSAHVQLSDEVRRFAEAAVPADRPLGEAIASLHHQIYSDFAYTKGATTVNSTLPELLESRAGVCQDFAHLAVACFRAAGLPARYVSGYIETTPPPGTTKLAGSDATHAWVSVFTPAGWVDLDPTNDHLADSRYIVTAWGRDFRDVSPLRGVIFTEATRSSLTVGVEVTRLDTER